MTADTRRIQGRVVGLRETDSKHTSLGNTEDLCGFDGSGRRVASRHSGSTLIEVCVAMTLLWSLGFISAAAQTQALAMLTSAMEYRKAVWIAAGAAESLRAGDPSGRVAREWSATAARALGEGRVSIRSVPGHAMVIEVAWVSRRAVHAATCAQGNACVAIVVGVFHSTAR